LKVIYRIIKSKKFVFALAAALQTKKIKNIVIPEIPTVEDVIIEVIQHYKPIQRYRTNKKINHPLQVKTYQ
jgi:hypothetical protein